MHLEQKHQAKAGSFFKDFFLGLFRWLKIELKVKSQGQKWSISLNIPCPFCWHFMFAGHLGLYQNSCMLDLPETCPETMVPKPPGDGKKTIMNKVVLWHQLRLIVYPIIYKVLYIPGGAGFLPSTEWSSVQYKFAPKKKQVFFPPERFL